MKWPFQRKNKDNVPAEIQNYYQAEKRERTGVAWLVAIVTLLITIAIALSLFFGGRWLYRQLRGDDTPADDTTSQGETSELPGDAQTTPPPNDKPDDPPADQPADDDENEDTDSDAPDADTPEEVTTPPPAAAPSPPARLPSDGGGAATTADPLPDTGPGDVLQAFGVATALGATAHGLYRRR